MKGNCGGTAAFGLTDENGAGVMLSTVNDKGFQIDIDPEDLHLIVEAGLCLVLTRTSRNKFGLSILERA